MALVFIMTNGPVCHESLSCALLEHKAEGRIFNAIFAQLKQRGIQRTDSLAIYTHCRLLKRIELCVETMRVVIKELLHRDGDWTRATLPADWEERYARRCKSERLSEEERQTLAVVVGDDGQWLLDRLAQEDAVHLAELRTVETLRDVWKVHYERGADGHMRWTTDGEPDRAGPADHRKPSLATPALRCRDDPAGHLAMSTLGNDARR
jgi:hypothetical protein